VMGDADRSAKVRQEAEAARLCLDAPAASSEAVQAEACSLLPCPRAASGVESGLERPSLAVSERKLPAVSQRSLEC
jgi:hypothetical protein